MNNKFLIIDLEATCWDGPVPEGQINEIIEIGACEVDLEKLIPTVGYSLMVKPETSSISPFCTKLTTITQEFIDTTGTSFDEACSYLEYTMETHTMPWGSYGDYDKNMMKKECERKGVRYPLHESHLNVKKMVTHVAGKKMGMDAALKFFSIPLEGTHHRGIDDALNIAKIFCFLLRNHRDELSAFNLPIVY